MAYKYNVCQTNLEVSVTSKTTVSDSSEETNEKKPWVL